MSDNTDGVKEISEVIASPGSPTGEDGKGFYDDIPEPQQEGQPDEVEEVQDEEPENVDKKGAQHRIKELNEKAKAEKARADSLAEQLEKLTATSPTPNWDELNQPLPTDDNGQVDAAEFEKRVLAKAAAISEIKSAQSQMVQRINAEAQEVMAKYPILNPDVESHDKELSESVTEAALAYVKANPTASLKKFVDKLMAPYERSISKQVGGLTETITKQAVETALRPNSAPKGEKRLEDMSLAEMEAHLGKVY
jgi:hypothetical protein